MGEVIGFRLREQARRPPVEAGPAQILFFTGVRYQRNDENASRPGPGPSDPGENRRGGKLGGRRRRRD